MKVYHPHHRTAWSRRTSGFPIYAVGPDGKVLGRLEARKRAGFINVPDGTRYLVHLYWSNSGRLTIFVYRPEDGLPEVASWTEGDGFEALDRLAAMLGWGEIWHEVIVPELE